MGRKKLQVKDHNIKLAFYKNPKSLFGKVIVWKQRKKLPLRYARYCHVELVFEDDLAFSSSEQDGGTRFKKINFDGRKWDFINIPVTLEEYNKVYEFCRNKEGNAYNWIGIFGAQALNMNIKGIGDYFCSEICTASIQQICIMCGENAVFVSPGYLAMYLAEIYKYKLID